MDKKFHKTNTPCRNCGHLFYNHCLHTEVRQGSSIQDFIQILEFVPCNEYNINSPAGNGSQCNCRKWETTDNLEWLELKATEQELKGE